MLGRCVSECVNFPNIELAKRALRDYDWRTPWDADGACFAATALVQARWNEIVEHTKQPWISG